MVRDAAVKNKSHYVTTERKVKYDTTALVLDLKKCTGCNLCWTVCPRYAIERGPIGASIRNRVEAPTIRINYHKCIFCGLCSYICPFDALKLTINGKPAEKLKVGVVLPYLEGEKVKCRRTGYEALHFMDGNITVDNEKCPGGCSTCIEICPVQCLYLPVSSKEKPWEEVPKVAVNRDKCLYCGACLFACPANGAIEMERTEIKCSEEGSQSRIWQNIKEKLLKPIKSRHWFYEKREKTAPGGDKKSAPKRKELKES